MSHDDKLQKIVLFQQTLNREPQTIELANDGTETQIRRQDLPESKFQMIISFDHANISVKNREVFLTDTSTNGTYVKQNVFGKFDKLDKGKKTKINNGAFIAFGGPEQVINLVTGASGKNPYIYKLDRSFKNTYIRE